MQISRFRYLLLSLYVLISDLAVAQKTIPLCAESCFNKAAKSIGCDSGDYYCICAGNNLSTIESAATTCVLDSCGATEALRAQKAAEEICAGFSSLLAAQSSTVASTIDAATTTPAASSVSSASSGSIINNAAPAASTKIDTTPSPESTPPTTNPPTTTPSNSAGTTSPNPASSPSPGDSPVSNSAKSSGLKPGIIAAIVIVIVLILLLLLGIFLFLRRRKRLSESRAPHGAELESRQIGEMDARDTAISRPIDEQEKQAPAYDTVYSPPPVAPISREPTTQHYNDMAARREMDSTSPPSELEGMRATMSSPSELSGYSSYHPPRSEMSAGEVNAPQEIHSQTSVLARSVPREMHTSPRLPVVSAVGDESPEELERLAEEERRLDEEIAEAERLRELKRQRASVQERLARARGDQC